VAVAQFVLTGVVAVAVLGFVAIHVLEQTGRREAIRDAQRETTLAGRGIVAPAIAAGALAGQPAAIARLDRIVRRSVLRDPVVRVKIWDASGRIIYSDEHRLIGARYRLDPAELKALRGGGTDADLSDLSRPENRFERSQHKLLEVYLGIRATTGTPLLFEDYLRDSSISASGQRLLRAFAPGIIIALLVLELAQIPLAWRLAQRVRRGYAEREALLRRAIDASETERRRIARDLHDGAVQNLAGVSFSLAAASEAVANGRYDAAAATVERAATDTRQSIRELRTLLVDIYPPNLRRAGLVSALADLVASLPDGAPRVAVDVDPDVEPELHGNTEPLLYRTAQEALRNVISHADASHVSVTLARHNGSARLTVTDDGRGFTPSALDDTDSMRRHFGLRILGDLAADAGGQLTVDSRPGRGTTVEIRVPVR
jgi:signal transduction histidine kinase